MLRVAVLACVMVACAEPRTSAPVATKAAPRLSATSSAEPKSPEMASVDRWPDLLRATDYRAALRVLDALPDARTRAPEIRYARARARMALGDFEGAAPLLGGLPRELPAIASQIARDQAECALTQGPFEEAVRYFETHGDAASLVKAALAAERAGNRSHARVLLDRTLRMTGAADDPELSKICVAARTSRARLAEAAGDRPSRIVDLRWLAVEAPATEEGRKAVEDLSRASPSFALTAEERLSRSRKLAEAGLLDEALAELDLLKKASQVAPLPLLRARAQAHYVSRKSYATAAELYEQAAKAGGKDAAHDAFYAARALSRAQDDAQAIDRYEALVSRFPASEFAEEAKYQSARLRLLLGKWDDAIGAYHRYLTRYGAHGGGRFRAAANYELALSEMAGKHCDRAAKLFRGLADAATDPLDRAALTELEGASLAEASDPSRATERLSSVIREQPLTFAALASAARLGMLGAPVPNTIRDAGSARTDDFAVDLPDDVALLSKLGLDEDAERALSAHESELVSRYAPRGYQALCAAYGKIGGGAARYRVGRMAVKKETFQKLPTDDTRWAWECVYPEPWNDLVRAAEERRGLPEGLLHAVMRQESAFRPDAVSPASAVGLLQLIPGTAERAAQELGIEARPELLSVPSYNVELGAYYLHRVLDLFGGDVAVAAAAYNAGPRAVSRWLATGETLPLDLWVARIPYAETRNYVSRVIGNLARYAYLRGGEREIPKLSLSLPQGTHITDQDY